MPGRYQVSVMTKANKRYATATPKVIRDCNTAPSRCAPPSTPGAENEQQLPGERIEKPVAFGIARQVPVEVPGEHVEQHRSTEGKRSSKLQQPQDRRKQEQQHDVERQYVHVGWLELEQQRLDDRHLRLFEKVENIHLFGIERILETGGNIG